MTGNGSGPRPSTGLTNAWVYTVTLAFIAYLIWIITH
jgi:hypothetical protein